MQYRKGSHAVLADSLTRKPNWFFDLQNDDLLIAKRDIKKGEELCYDYALTEGDPDWVLASCARVRLTASSTVNLTNVS